MNQAGGYCHQLNELLAVALTELGFTVQQVSVIVSNQQTFDPHQLSTHHILIINLEDKHFLADVGFGYKKKISYILQKQNLWTHDIISYYLQKLIFHQLVFSLAESADRFLHDGRILL